MASGKEKHDNVKRLAEAGILDDSELAAEGTKAINSIVLSDTEIKTLMDIKNKLSLDSIKLDRPGSKIWRL